MQPPRLRTVPGIAPTGRYAECFIDPEGLDIGLGAVSDGGLLASFVEFCLPGPGVAVVEVGAGTGLLTFEGGLAAAIGPRGELVATDPVAALLRLFVQKRAREGAGQVRVLRAAAEALPVADAQADLVCGSRFLQYCDVPRALAEMVRVTRPGGTVAVLAVLQPVVGPGWLDVLRPLRAATRRAGRIVGAGLPHCSGAVASAFTAAGLCRVETQRRMQRADFPDYATCVRLLTQLSCLEALLVGLAAGEAEAALHQAYSDVRTMFGLRPPEQRRLLLRYEFVRGRVPD